MRRVFLSTLGSGGRFRRSEITAEAFKSAQAPIPSMPTAINGGIFRESPNAGRP